MITKVEARSVTGLLLVLPLDEVSNGFVIQDILGLDPVKGTIISSSFAQVDGSQYQSSRRENRNILMKIGLEPDFSTTTVRDLRKILYSFFMPKSEINLRFFMSDGLTIDINGRIESCDTPLFVKEPRVDISIICFDPDFKELAPEIIEDTTVSDSSEFLIEYEGTVETGIIFVLSLNRALTEFTIYHRPPDNVIRTLDFAASLEDEDVLTINTVVGSKAITLLRDST